MSRENVEIVRKMIAAWERGDFASGASWHSPDIRFETFMPDSDEPRRAEGLAGLEIFGREWFGQWREYRIVAKEVRAVGEHRVFASVRQFGIGKTSGAVVESDGYVVCTLSEGRITKMSLHYDRAEALEAVGLPEQAMRQENVEQLYRRILDAWNEADVEGCLALLTEDVAISTALGGVEGEYSGHDGARRWWSDFHDVFPDWHAKLLTLRSVGSATLAQLRLTGHGGGSGAPVDETMWHVVHWRDGRGWRITRHDTEAEALEAVGLSE